MSIFLIAVAFMASLTLSQATLMKRMADEDSPDLSGLSLELLLKLDFQHPQLVLEDGDDESLFSPPEILIPELLDVQSERTYRTSRDKESRSEVPSRPSSESEEDEIETKQQSGGNGDDLLEDRASTQGMLNGIQWRVRRARMSFACNCFILFFKIVCMGQLLAVEDEVNVLQAQVFGSLDQVFLT